ncbi:single-stranded DNA-binding protein [Pseudomonas sp. Irchel s3b5]|uniref:single-stranded DNA-binding protein n=1 Tax=Pseudomonas sp. Irchel s3b5 TaxID=2009077 RepID=UPI000BA393D0|nr:single-stranded DNA-binding protein [Pseudomonas sp. Irchel s3b5]
MPTLTDVGRIGRDAELRFTPSGDPVINLALACDYGRKGQDGKRPTQWVDATLWGKQAEAMAPYLLKGQQVYFTMDDAHIETYAKTGGGEGFKLTGKIILIKFVGSPPQAANQPQQQARPQQSRQQAAAQPAQNQQAAPPDSFDDDIPFAPLHHLNGA